MINLLLRNSILILFTAILAVTFSVPAQAREIQTSLRPGKSAYLLGEPIILEVRFANWYTPEMIFTGSVAYASSDTHLQSRRPGNVWGPDYRAHHRLQPMSPKSLFLEYGRALPYRFLAICDREKDSNLLFETPGKVQFRLRQSFYYRNVMEMHKGDVAYETETQSPIFQILEPQGKNQAAFQRLQTRPTVFTDFNRLLASPGNVTFLEKFVRDFPDTPYTPFALHSLGALSYTYGKHHLLDEQEKARQYFETILEDHPDYSLRDDVTMQLVNLYRETGELDRAVALLEKAIIPSENKMFYYRSSPLIRDRVDIIVTGLYQRLPSLFWPLFDNPAYPLAVDQFQD